MKFPIYRKQVKSSRRKFVDVQNNRLFYRNIYLNSNHWKSIRDEKLEQVYCCELCGSKLSLDVHHKNYRNLYDVRMSDLQVLCRLCHLQIHHRKHKKEKRGDGIPKKGKEFTGNRYPKNVKKSKEWMKMDTSLISNMYARSKIYSDYYKYFL